jgi:transcriptional regulator with XRE-family HTH domain
MDINEIRLKNLEHLISSSGLNAAKFADKIDMSASQLSQTRSSKYKRNIGTATARKIEQLLSLPNGWMDQLHYDGQVIADGSNTYSPPALPATEALNPLQSRFDSASPAVQRIILDLLEADISSSIDQNITTSLHTLLKAAKKQGLRGVDLEVGKGDLYD